MKASTRHIGVIVSFALGLSACDMHTVKHQESAPHDTLAMEEPEEHEAMRALVAEALSTPALPDSTSPPPTPSKAITGAIQGLGAKGRGAGGGGMLLGGKSKRATRYQSHYGQVHRAPAAHRMRHRGIPNTEAYDTIEANGYKRVSEAPLSTFSIDVDTASYANVRRMLREGRLPVRGAVRIEEMLNYFDYSDASPTQGETPFAIHSEVGSAPWNPAHRLVRIGVKARELERGTRPASNIVFLLDVSGSMSAPDKLPLLKKAFKVLVNQLDERDTVTIAVYAGSSGLALPPTPGSDKTRILNAISQLRSAGSTHGAAGIKLAYNMASEHFIKGGINRVILATDGDMNVGTSSKSELVDLVTDKAKSGVFLSVLGFGRGNLKDATMEAIANNGNGNYAYIDSVREARKVLGDQFGGTLMTIAKDVKLQVEFNPANVAGYRLIGYENRVLAAQDFNNDKKDAGELGAGHSVTALYELVPVGLSVPDAAVDDLKYQKTTATQSAEVSDELLTLKLRYKAPEGSTSKLVQRVVRRPSRATKSSDSFRWASAVATFGMLLRKSPHRGEATWEGMIDLASGAIGKDPNGHRMEMVVLAKEAHRLTQSLAQRHP